LDEEELIKFWNTSASGAGHRNFKNYSTLQDGAFFHKLVVSYISGKKLLVFSWKFCHFWTRKFPLNFGSQLDPYRLSLSMEVCSLWDSCCRCFCYY